VERPGGKGKKKIGGRRSSRREGEGSPCRKVKIPVDSCSLRKRKKNLGEGRVTGFKKGGGGRGRVGYDISSTTTEVLKDLEWKERSLKHKDLGDGSYPFHQKE